MTVTCRPATAADAAAIAEVRIRSWQTGYRDIVPADYLAALSPRAEADRRRARMPAGGPSPGELVAEVDAAVVGWASVGPYRDDDAPAPAPDCGEVYAIYVLPQRWGIGAGRALLAYGLDRLAADGLAPVLLWVFGANERARRFYERAGFRADGPSHDYDVGGAALPELRYRLDPPGTGA